MKKSDKIIVVVVAMGAVASVITFAVIMYEGVLGG